MASQSNRPIFETNIGKISLDPIPLYRPDLSGNERRYVLDCLDSTWISSRGGYLGRFEQEFSQKVGVRHATAVCNGTVALHLALLALGIGPGDEVIVPTLTYISSVNAITYTGAKPVFADCAPNTWQSEAAEIERHITKKTRALLVVHLYGNACVMSEIEKLAKDHGLFIVEDCAEAFGTFSGGRHVGTVGDVGTFSFFGNKTITTGEGGMVVANDAALLKRTIHLKGQGLATGREYWHDVIGYNYRMTNIAAALGLAQLERADALLAMKRNIAILYRTSLAGVPVAFQDVARDAIHSHWMVAILTREARDRDLLRKALQDAQVETRPLFFPIHTMPMYASAHTLCPVASDLASRGILLPSWPGLTETQVGHICDVIKNFYPA